MKIIPIFPDDTFDEGIFYACVSICSLHVSEECFRLKCLKSFLFHDYCKCMLLCALEGFYLLGCKADTIQEECTRYMQTQFTLVSIFLAATHGTPVLAWTSFPCRS